MTSRLTESEKILCYLLASSILFRNSVTDVSNTELNFGFVLENSTAFYGLVYLADMFHVMSCDVPLIARTCFLFRSQSVRVELQLHPEHQKQNEVRHLTHNIVSRFTIFLLVLDEIYWPFIYRLTGVHN